MNEEDQAWLKTIGEIFRGIREEQGLTQRQAACLAGSTQARISDIELGKADILLTTLEKWARVYGYEVNLEIQPIEGLEVHNFNEELQELVVDMETST